MRSRIENCIRLGTVVLGCSGVLALGEQNTPSGYVLTDIGRDYRVFSKVRLEQDERGKVVSATNSYTEIGAGLNYLEGGKWKESVPEFEFSDKGVVAKRGAHQVTLSADAHTPGAVEITTPEGQKLRSHVLGLSYSDSSSGKTVLIASTANSIGQVLPTRNEVLYPNAFTIPADLLYTYTRAGFRQDVILREQPPAPELFGLKPETTRLQVLTEFLEAPEPVKRPRMVPLTSKTVTGARQETIDEELGFGSMKMRNGKAFRLADNKESSRQFPVTKQWKTVGSRRILIEELPWSLIAPELATLPRPQILGRVPGSSFGSSVCLTFDQIIPQPPVGKTDDRKMLLASSLPEQIGFVVDYDLYGGLTDFTFRGDITYHVTSSVYLFGTTTIEGGTVVKSSVNQGPSIWLDANAPLVCKTSPYRPAIFTSKNNNAVGQTIPGSSGVPSMGDVEVALTAGGEYFQLALHDLRIEFAGTCFLLDTWGEAQLSVTDSQILRCQTGISLGNASHPYFYFGNVLFYEFQTAAVSAWGQDYIITGEHITARNTAADGAFFWGEPSSGSEFVLRNSIVSELYDQAWIGCTPSLDHTSYPVPSYQFDSEGGGACYRNSERGDLWQDTTTGIDPALAARIRQKTTTAPATLSGPIDFDAVWEVNATRDDSNSYRGYHYDPIDYLVNNIEISSALTISDGVVAGVFGNQGFHLTGSTARISSKGTPGNMARVVSAVNVQEQAFIAPGNNLLSLSSGCEPYLDFCFTEISLAPGASSSFFASTSSGNFKGLRLRDCQIHDLSLSVAPQNALATVSLQNNVWDQCHVSITRGNTSPFWASLYNNLFLSARSNPSTGQPQTALALNSDAAGASCPNWEVHDNLFDKAPQTLTPANPGNISRSHNAFTAGTVNNLGGTANQSGMTINYEAGSLGRFYLPQSVTQLINQGSRLASTGGLKSYTTVIANTPESASQVDIGFHYVVVDEAGVPLDDNQDGAPDYLLNYDAPVIVAPPQGFSVNVGNIASLTVVAFGEGLQYQWFHNAAAIPGATQSTYRWSMRPQDVGLYFVRVLNSSGQVETCPVTVSLNTAPPNCQGSFTYDSDVNFGSGTLLNANANSGILQLNPVSTTPYPYVNVACSARGTLVRINAATGNVYGEYLTAPQSVSFPNPSRTTVDKYGNVWVANRSENGWSGGFQKGSITRIGVIIGGTRCNADGSTSGGSLEYLKPPFDFCTVVDRFGTGPGTPPDGLIKTSSGLGDIRAWANSDGSDTHGGVSTAEDEAIITYTRVGCTGARTLAIDKNNDVWVGGTGESERWHQQVSGNTGEADPSTLFGFSYGGYGGFIDRYGVLWSADPGSSMLRWNLNTGTYTSIDNIYDNYGLGIDPQSGEVWRTLSSDGNVVGRYASSGARLSGHAHGVNDTYAQGVVVDGASNVWVAHQGGTGRSVGHLRTSGLLVGEVVLKGGEVTGPTGVAVDCNGKIWVANLDDNSAMRIDPNSGANGGGGYKIGAVDRTVSLGAGAGPYNYSDMTGFILFSETSPTGIWRRVHDSGCVGAVWNSPTWLGQVPVGTQLKVEVRAANQLGQLLCLPFQLIENQQAACAAGRYLEVRVTLSRDKSVTAGSPLIDRLTVTWGQ